MTLYLAVTDHAQPAAILNHLIDRQRHLFCATTDHHNIMAVMADRRSQRTFIQAKAAEQTTGRSQSLSVTLKNGNKAHIIAIKTVFAVDAGAGVRDQFVMDYLNNAIAFSGGKLQGKVAGGNWLAINGIAIWRGGLCQSRRLFRL
ncbi:hypothetical protein ExPUPEC79_00915 [Escherichia coli]|nr:hypothetical protein ExPCM16_02668 [Escherichia coli]GDU79082.1 hypothetical protein ExPUPEC79_00915 [Escherichia coli]